MKIVNIILIKFDLSYFCLIIVINQMAIRNTRCVKNIQTIATEIAKKSPCSHKHGSLITRGSNKIVATGFNNNMRTEFLGKHDCCMHAEMAAALKFINGSVRRKGKKYRF